MALATSGRVQLPSAVTSLVDLLRWRADEHPERRMCTFLSDGVDESAVLSYAELDMQARQIAALLQQHAAPRERALLLYPPGLDFVAAFFGCLYAGVIAVPAYPPHPSRIEREVPRLRAVGTDAGATMLLTTSEQEPVVRRLLSAMPEMQGVRVLTTNISDPEMVGAWRPPSTGGDAVAFLQYTSGSTAAPKGVVVTHGNLLANERMLNLAFGFPDEWTVVGWLPLYHDMGLIGNLLQPLYAGAHCALMPPAAFLQRPLRWLQAISRYRAYVSGGPNFAYQWCVSKIAPEQREGLDLSSWRVAYNGSEPIHASTLRAFLDAYAPYGLRESTLYPCYGLAESTLFATGSRPGERWREMDVDGVALERGEIQTVAKEHPSCRTLVSSGQAWLEREVAIVDPETRLACPLGRVGEIWLGGPDVAQGYWGRPAQSALTFKARIADTGAGPYLRTGDLGTLVDGELFVTGRLKDLIILEGRNLYPQDIELTAEESHGALRPASSGAFGVEVDKEERPVLVAEIERDYQSQRRELLTAEESARLEEVAEAVRLAVARYHGVQLHEVVFLRIGAMLKTSSGKIRRRLCRSQYLEHTLEGILYRRLWPRSG